MNAARAAWVRAASSGEFFTRWSWLLTLPFAVTILGGYDQAGTTEERLAGFGAALAVHVGVGVVGVVGAAGERTVASVRARIGVVVGTLAVISVVRPLSLAWAAEEYGLTLFAGPPAGRFVTNLVVTTALLSMVAITTVTVRSHRVVVGRLRAVLGALEERRSHDLADVAELSALVLESTRSTVLAALPPVTATPSDPEQGAHLLKCFADEIIRPTSHRLFDESASRRSPMPEDGFARDGGGSKSDRRPAAQGWRPLIRDLRAAPTWMTAISYALLWIPYLVGQLPLLVCAFVLALAVVVGGVGNGLVRGATQGATGAHRLGALAGRYAVVGAGIGAATGGAMAYASPSFAGDRFVPTILLSALCYPAFAVVAAAAKTGFRRLAAIESELAAATDQATASAAEAQNKLIVARRRVAHLLHSDVQAECSAAARSLRASHTLTESDWTTVLARIESAFDRPRLGVHGNDAQQTLDGVLGAWRFSMDITVTADPRVWARLDADASRLELAIDIIAEALTNTIRHGTELRARIALDPSPSARGILVAVESAGRLDERGRRDGHGLAQLASRARCLSLTQERSDVILRVEIA